MIGAGQLARMSQQAAVDLDVELHVLAQRGDDPAVQAGASYRVGRPDDDEAVLAVAENAEVVTFDHELVPQGVLARLEEAGHQVRPSPQALRFSQDKLHARRHLAEAGFPVPPWAPVHGPADVADFAAEHGWPVVLKARRGGYDGRGVLLAEGPDDVPKDLDWGTPAAPTWLAEAFVDLATELAVLVARRPSGQSAIYPVVETNQQDGICVELVTPARVDDDVAREARDVGARVAEHIGAVGICAVELFVSRTGSVLVNELALRPHNSGHATIEANATSQFHQHLRAVLDWPLGATDLLVPAAAMVNLIGVPDVPEPDRNLPLALEQPGAHVHLYAKQSRPGRKIGHVTVLASTVEDALAEARAARDALLSPGRSR